MLVPDGMLKVEDPLRLPTNKPRTVNHVRFVCQNGHEWLRVFLRGKLQVRILGDDDISDGFRNTRPQCSALPVVLAMVDYANAIATLKMLSKYLARLFGGKIIHQ